MIAPSTAAAKLGQRFADSRPDPAYIKGGLDLRDLIEAEAGINRAGKTTCPNPAHQDLDPSCHVYDDHLHCFGCGWHGDVFDYLMATRGCSFPDALREAQQLAGTITPVRRPRPRRPVPSLRVGPACVAPNLPEHVVALHFQQAESLRRTPSAIEGRGITFEACKASQIAEDCGDAIVPIPNPAGGFVALKRRYCRPHGSGKYRYDAGGQGLPAWCSRNLSDAREILLVEGELNGLVCFVARTDLGVQGIAGTNGSLWLSSLLGRVVYVYADPDDVGQAARQKWADAAHRAGAHKVFVVDPWPEGDACDVAGNLGLEVLRERLS